MSASDNLQLVRDMHAALNAQDLDAHDAYWHEDMIWHGPPGFGDVHGLAAFKRDVMVPFYTAFPDYFAKNDIEFADDTWVATTGYLTGTHLGLPRLPRDREEDAHALHSDATGQRASAYR